MRRLEKKPLDLETLTSVMRSFGAPDAIEPMCGLWDAVFSEAIELGVITERIEMTRSLCDRLTAGIPLHRGGSGVTVTFGPGVEITIREPSPYMPDSWIRLWGYLRRYESDASA